MGNGSRLPAALLSSMFTLFAMSCVADEGETLAVTATAYNSVASQTNAKPNLSAWGDQLEPGMKAIAVSRDLIALGLTHGVEVTIEGLDGVYIVRDKMAKRWKKKIDVYMGTDVEAARRWGKKTITIRWKRSSPEQTQKQTKR
jgi:3D (Asp-Asp-Asp) domain-containing protein